MSGNVGSAIMNFSINLSGIKSEWSTAKNVTKSAIDSINKHITSLANNAAKAADAGSVLSKAFALSIIIKSLTTFAYNLSQVAARTEMLGVVVRNVGKNLGYSTKEIMDYTDAVRAMGITTQASYQVVAKFLQQNLNLAQAAKLARIAQDSAQIAGIDSSVALQGLVHGVVTQQVEILRTYGIVINIDRELTKYARKLGVTRDSVDEFTRQQVILNAVLRKGDRIAGSYEAAMDTVGKQMRSLPRYVQEMENIVGEQLLPTLAKAVNFVKELVTTESNIEKLKDTLAGFMPILNVLVSLLSSAVSIATTLGPAVGTIVQIWALWALRGKAVVVTLSLINKAIQYSTSIYAAFKNNAAGAKEALSNLFFAKDATKQLGMQAEFFKAKQKELEATKKVNLVKQEEAVRNIEDNKNRIAQLEALEKQGALSKDNLIAYKKEIQMKADLEIANRNVAVSELEIAEAQENAAKATKAQSISKILGYANAVAQVAAIIYGAYIFISQFFEETETKSAVFEEAEKLEEKLKQQYELKAQLVSAEYEYLEAIEKRVALQKLIEEKGYNVEVENKSDLEQAKKNYFLRNSFYRNDYEENTNTSNRVPDTVFNDSDTAAYTNDNSALEEASKKHKELTENVVHETDAKIKLEEIEEELEDSYMTIKKLSPQLTDVNKDLASSYNTISASIEKENVSLLENIRLRKILAIAKLEEQKAKLKEQQKEVKENIEDIGDIVLQKKGRAYTSEDNYLEFLQKQYPDIISKYETNANSDARTVELTIDKGEQLNPERLNALNADLVDRISKLKALRLEYESALNDYFTSDKEGVEQRLSTEEDNLEKEREILENHNSKLKKLEFELSETKIHIMTPESEGGSSTTANEAKKLTEMERNILNQKKIIEEQEFVVKAKEKLIEDLKPLYEDGAKSNMEDTIDDLEERGTTLQDILNDVSVLNTNIAKNKNIQNELFDIQNKISAEYSLNSARIATQEQIINDMIKQRISDYNELTREMKRTREERELEIKERSSETGYQEFSYKKQSYVKKVEKFYKGLGVDTSKIKVDVGDEIKGLEQYTFYFDKIKEALAEGKITDMSKIQKTAAEQTKTQFNLKDFTPSNTITSDEFEDLVKLKDDLAVDKNKLGQQLRKDITEFKKIKSEFYTTEQNFDEYIKNIEDRIKVLKNTSDPQLKIEYLNLVKTNFDNKIANQEVLASIAETMYERTPLEEFSNAYVDAIDNQKKLILESQGVTEADKLQGEQKLKYLELEKKLTEFILGTKERMLDINRALYEFYRQDEKNTVLKSLKLSLTNEIAELEKQLDKPENKLKILQLTAELLSIDSKLIESNTELINRGKDLVLNEDRKLEINRDILKGYKEAIKTQEEAISNGDKSSEAEQRLLDLKIKELNITKEIVKEEFRLNNYYLSKEFNARKNLSKESSKSVKPEEEIKILEDYINNIMTQKDLIGTQEGIYSSVDEFNAELIKAQEELIEAKIELWEREFTYVGKMLSGIEKAYDEMFASIFNKKEVDSNASIRLKEIEYQEELKDLRRRSKARGIEGEKARLEEQILIEEHNAYLEDLEEKKRSFMSKSWDIIKSSAVDAIRDIIKEELIRHTKTIYHAILENTLNTTLVEGKNQVKVVTSALSSAETLASAATVAAATAGSVALAGQIVAVQTLTKAYLAAYYAMLLANPLTTITAPAVFAASIGEMAVALKSASAAITAIGFEKGGIFEKGQRGFIEGYGREIIAPEEDFKTAFAKMSYDIYSSIERNRVNSLGGIKVSGKELEDIISNSEKSVSVDLKGSFVAVNDRNTVEDFSRKVLNPALKKLRIK